MDGFSTFFSDGRVRFLKMRFSQFFLACCRGRLANSLTRCGVFRTDIALNGGKERNESHHHQAVFTHAAGREGEEKASPASPTIQGKQR